MLQTTEETIVVTDSAVTAVETEAASTETEEVTAEVTEADSTETEAATAEENEEASTDSNAAEAAVEIGTRDAAVIAAVSNETKGDRRNEKVTANFYNKKAR
jgi:hypothetical protein